MITPIYLPIFYSAFMLQKWSWLVVTDTMSYKPKIFTSWPFEEVFQLQFYRRAIWGLRMGLTVWERTDQGTLKWEDMWHVFWWRRKFVVKLKQKWRSKAGGPSSSLCKLMAESLFCAVVHLILFYENRLKDHHLVIPSVLQGLKALVSSLSLSLFSFLFITYC